MVAALRPPRRTRVHHRPLPDAAGFERVLEGDGFARVRYRGGQGRKGAATQARCDALDVMRAMTELGAAHELLVRADRPDINPDERRHLMAEARAKAALASRFSDNVAEGRPRCER